MKNLVNFINKLPLAGKLAIRPLAFNFYQSTTIVGRRWSYLLLMAFLVFFVFAHGKQAIFGFEVLSFSLPVWVNAISLLYVCANVAAIFVQIHLGYRASKFLSMGLFSRKKRRYVAHSFSEVIIMIIVTCGGQMIFMILYSLYR